MAYQKQEWTTKKPITAECLNHMENGIGENDINITNLSKDVKIDYINNQEVATNEYINGKRVYAKRFETSSLLNNATKLSLPHSISNYDLIWIDTSNSFVIAHQGEDNVISYPIITNMSDMNSSSTIQATIKGNNIEIYATGGWAEAWKKLLL